MASYRNDIPQEGAIRISGHGDGTDLRISFVPAREAEKVVIRIFGTNSDIGLTELGFSETVLKELNQLLQRREGMILLTGPSASGKTTTLYTALRSLIEGTRKGANVVSIEDPIECAIPGITQVQVDPRRDMTFNKLLGNLLRQDAEVVMVGEIRDVDTAGVAVGAALTGHLILSTIHAGRAPEILVRLLDLGIEPYKIASSLVGAMAQRLVRTVCEHCREEYRPSDDLLSEYEHYMPKDTTFSRGTGCDLCYGTGYRGRTAIAELVTVDLSWQELIRSRPTSADAMDLAIEKGMVPMYRDAVEKAAAGLTTLEEIKRVLG